MLRAVTSLVAPPLCAICGGPCDHRDRACSACSRRLSALCPGRTLLAGSLEVISAAPYEDVARRLVARMKFSGRVALAEPAAERMVRAWGAARSGWLVPVPPAPARERARGFDTAHLLARLVAERTLDSRVSACLARDDGPRQVGRPRARRTSDPPRVRMLDPRARLPSDDLWLVDDVATTGATLLACADVLRAAGAARVRALTFARVDEQALGPGRLAA